jgi:RluA family pseudouridine synthase
VSAAIKLSAPASREFWEIPVLFEDEQLLALDKPAGLLTSPDRHDEARPSLMRLLLDGLAAGKPWARERGLTYLSNAHRLDCDTSGVLLLAKSKPVLVTLADFFGAEKPLRKYIVLAWGRPTAARFEVEAKLAPHPVKPGQMCVNPLEGKKSRTEFEVLEQFSDWTLLRATALTDRTHQIRVHLKHAGFPVVADELYGGKKLWLSRLKRDFRLKPGREERPLLSRAALHAEELTLPHPVTNEIITIQSEWPKDLRVAVKYLRQYATGPSRRGLTDDAEQFSEE